jgi:uncharacterized protein YjbJ (UPF0337 family)
MGAARNQARNTSQAAKGKVKETAGRATGRRKLQAKGTADQAKANVKKAGERVKRKGR